jgi:GNAT superfamily N-acetyltransferase
VSHAASKAEFRVREFRSSDEAAVLELLRSTLGEGPVGERSSAFFRWKHMANPFGSSIMLVAESEGLIIGLRAFMRWRFLVGKQTIFAVQAVDTATHPDFQNRGVFSTLTRTAIDRLREDVDLIYNTPNEKSLPGYLKLGWRPVTTFRVSLRVRHPIAFGRGLIQPDRMQERRPSPAVDAEPVTTLLDSGTDLSDMLLGVDAAGEGITTERSADYLRWRYVAVPNLEYFAIPAHEYGDLRGVAIFRLRERGALWETALVELLVRRGDRQIARALVRKVINCTDTDHVTSYFRRGTVQAGALRTSGFLRSRRGVSFVVNPLSAHLLPPPESPDSWALSLGDLEVF